MREAGERRRTKMATAETTSANILSEGSREARGEILAMLEHAYWMEIETVMSYIPASVNPDGVRAEQVKASLREDIAEELGHAERFAARIKQLYGVVPGSDRFEAEQSFLQPPDDQADVVPIVRGVIEAERQAIEHYSRIIELTEGIDPVTQDIVIEILHDEQGHMRLFEGFLREYEGSAGS
jgi:bacterioferritin